MIQLSFAVRPTHKHELRSLELNPTLSWTTSARIWDQEYSGGQTIPSSRRDSPAHGLQQLTGSLDFTSSQVLDLGCGNGRNAFYLSERGATVHALDYSEVALSLLKNRSESRLQLRQSVVPILHDISNGLPFDSDTMDVVLDAYCLCHLDDKSADIAQQEVARVLRPGGMIIKLHLDSADTYYRNLSITDSSDSFVSFDPINGLHKRHFSLEQYRSDLQISAEYSLITSVHVEFLDDVRGRAYERSVFAAAFRKR